MTVTCRGMRALGPTVCVWFLVIMGAVAMGAQWACSAAESLDPGFFEALLAGKVMVDYTGIQVDVKFTSQGAEETVQRVWAKRPNKIRREYLSPEKLSGQVITSDGLTRWHYVPEMNYVLKEPFYSGSVKDDRDRVRALISRVRVRLVGREVLLGRRVRVFELYGPDKPDKPVARVWVDEELPLALKVERLIPGGGLQSLTFFSEISLNQDVPDEVFAFHAPEKAEVTTDREGFKRRVSLWTVQRKVKFTILVPTYLPEGYSFVDANFIKIEGGQGVHLRYAKGQGIISLFEIMVGTRLQGGEQIVVAKFRSKLTTLKNVEIIDWVRGNLRFTLLGSIGRDELQKIQGSIR